MRALGTRSAGSDFVVADRCFPWRCLELFRAFTFPDYQGDLSLYPSEASYAERRAPYLPVCSFMQSMPLEVIPLVPSCEE